MTDVTHWLWFLGISRLQFCLATELPFFLEKAKVLSWRERPPSDTPARDPSLGTNLNRVLVYHPLHIFGSCSIESGVVR